MGGGLTEANMINAARNILPKTKNQVFRFDLDGIQIVCELVKIRTLGDAPETKHMAISFSKSLQEEL